jgi:hypothetical protein
LGSNKRARSKEVERLASRLSDWILARGIGVFFVSNVAKKIILHNFADFSAIVHDRRGINVI